MIKVTIPGYSKAKYAAPLVRAIRASALTANVPVHVAATVMSEFFTVLADEVAEGNVFRIPGIGAFGGIVCTRRRNGDKFPAPVFVAGVAFRNDLLRTCETDANDKLVVPHKFYAVKKKLNVFRVSNIPRVQTRTRSARTAMASIRETVLAQAQRRRAV